jgi:DNA-binding beta-propeller fold protein YncE
VMFRLTRGEAMRVAEVDAGHDVRGVTFTPDGKYVLVQNAADEDLAVYSVSPTSIADTGVRLKVKGAPVSIRIAPR